MSDGTKTVVTFVTGNDNKLKEVQRMLEASCSVQSNNGSSTCLSLPLQIQIISQSIDLPELQGTPEEVAVEKCTVAAAQVNGPVIIEDTSLCFKALGGLPGVYIRHFYDKIGNDGLCKLLSAFDDKSAYAQCIFAFTRGPGEPIILFTGTTHGKIVSPRGEDGFAWDNIFEFTQNNESLTFAEMTPDVKNEVSHRKKALTGLCSFLRLFK